MNQTKTLPAFPPRRPRIAAIGVAAWERLLVVDRYPAPGDGELVQREFSGPGGSTLTAAAAAAKLGAAVSIRALAGDDQEGRDIRAALDRAGVDTGWLTFAGSPGTEVSTQIVSLAPPSRTVFRRPGARIARGDRIDIAALFAHDVVIVDVDHAPLRRFLVDLPAHTLPGARLLGTMTHLEGVDAFDIAMQFDAIVGDARQLQTVTRTATLEAAIAAIQGRMRGENLRAAIVTLGTNGALAITNERCVTAGAYSVEAVDANGAGDTFTGALAFGMSCRWTWEVAIDVANAVAALSTTALGALTALPSWDEVIAFMSRETPTPE